MSEAYPDVHEWTFTNKRTGESRVYQQSELTLDGEMQAFALLARTVTRLREADFPFDRLENVFPAAGGGLSDIDWAEVAVMLGQVASIAPGLVSETAAVLLAIFPVDEHNKRNPDYPGEVAFLRSAMHLSDLVEMLEVASNQNDTERLLAPFVKARAVLTSFGAGATEVASTPPSTSSSATGTARRATSAATTRGQGSPAP